MVRFKLKLTLHTSWTDWTLMTIWWDLVFIAQFLLLKLLSSTDEHTYWLLSLQSKNLHSCQSSKTKNGLLWINKDERILILTCIINTTASNLKLTICSLYLLVFFFVRHENEVRKVITYERVMEGALKRNPPKLGLCTVFEHVHRGGDLAGSN